MKPELLAPVGSPASLRAAVESGADSVYMGSAWNARMRARNFTNAELASAIKYCHKNKVMAYITVNTLIFENEMQMVADHIKFLYEHGADALIVQDLGVARMAREIAPDLELHASTQISTHNSKTAKLMKNLGFSRIILARELSIEQAKKIKENAGIDVEVFCHGSLCYSYSGKCFFSLIQTKRSANRGSCAQICRFPWKLYCDGKFVKDGYLTSTKDLNTLSRIPEISASGIKCIKIEGRLKDGEYIRQVVTAYRTAIDSGQTIDLSKLTSRSYTEGYLFGAARKEKLINQGAPSFFGSLVGRVVKADKKGAQVRLSSPLRIGDSVRASSSGKIIEIYRIYNGEQEVPEAERECILRIKTLRTGDTLYKVTRAQIEDSFLTRHAPERIKSAKPFTFESRKAGFEALPNLLYMKDKAQVAINPQNAYVVPLEDFTSDLAKNGKIIVDTPRVAFDDELPALYEKIKEVAESNPFAFMASEPSLVQEYGTIISPYANVTNTLALESWKGFGKVIGAVPSLEVAHLQSEYNELGFANYSGYPIELMISENDLFFELGISGKCELEDPRGNRFEIVKRGGRTVILKGKESGYTGRKPEETAQGKQNNFQQGHGKPGNFSHENKNNFQPGRNFQSQQPGKFNDSTIQVKRKYGGSDNQEVNYSSPQNRFRRQPYKPQREGAKNTGRDGQREGIENKGKWQQREGNRNTGQEGQREGRGNESKGERNTGREGRVHTGRWQGNRRERNTGKGGQRDSEKPRSFNPYSPKKDSWKNTSKSSSTPQSKYQKSSTNRLQKKKAFERR